ncbi:unnamed protein product, partial [Closterium sp. Naga37s-1]
VFSSAPLTSAPLTSAPLTHLRSSHLRSSHLRSSHLRSSHLRFGSPEALCVATGGRRFLPPLVTPHTLLSPPLRVPRAPLWRLVEGGSFLPSSRLAPSSHLRFGFPEALCGDWWKEYVKLHAGMREESKLRHAQAQSQAQAQAHAQAQAGVAVAAAADATAPAAAAAAAPAAASAPPLSPLPLPSSSPSPPPFRFLTYEVLFGCGGLGDALIGLVAAFTVALLDGRALILNHPCLPQAFDPAHVDWRLTDDIPMEPSRKYTYVPPPDVGPAAAGGAGANPAGGGSAAAESERASTGGSGAGSDAGEEPPEAAVQAGEVIRVNLKNRDVDLQPLFSRLAPAANILLRWNRGVLTRLFLEAYNADREAYNADEGGEGAFSGGCQVGGGCGCAVGSGLLHPSILTPPYLPIIPSLSITFLPPPVPLSPVPIPGSSFRLPACLASRPKPEVWQLIRPFDQQLRGDRTVVIGLHIRFEDKAVWGEGGEGAPLSLSEERVREMVEEVKATLECAKRVQEWHVPSSLPVKWLLLCNSMQVKEAIRKQYPDKVVTTDFTPRHTNSHFPLAPSSHSPIPYYPFLPSCLLNPQVVTTDFTPRHANSMSGEETTLQPSPSTSSTSSPASPSSPSSPSPPFLELIAEWLLLASSHFFIIPNSGFSRTALLYSMHPTGSAFMPPDNCFPDVPVNLTWLGTTWSRI